jgi:predicted O-methyltransferase YrrM
MKNEYSNKLDNFLFKEIKDLKDLCIVEFGVREGISTKKFLECCKKNKGKLFSIDIDDCSNVVNDQNWKFIKSRDDNFNFLEEKLPKMFDIILIDSFHNAAHVKKILFHYYKKLKPGGLLFIDDISWVPYVKNNYRNHFNSEINNLETFEMLNDVLLANQKNFNLYYTFVGSGMAKIVKLNDESLNEPIKIKSRKLSLKNIIRKFIKK